MAMDDTRGPGGGGSITVPRTWPGRRPGRRPRRRKHELSSASEFLTGFVFDGRPIVRITKLKGAQRRIYFGPQRYTDVDRATVHELAKWKGTIQYRQRLVNAPSLAARKHMIRRSRARQQAILGHHIADLERGAAAAPPHVRRRIGRRIATLRRATFGSPILGETPATSAVPPHYGPAKTFSTIKRTGVQFRTIRRRGRVRVIPIAG